MKQFLRRFFDGRVMVAAVSGLLVGVVGVSAVAAAPAGPGAPVVGGTPNAAPIPGIDLGALGRLGARNYRVEVNATNRSGSRTILYVRGAISMGTGQLTVTLPDNSTQVFTTDAQTVVRARGQSIPLSDLETGDRAMVFGLRNADGSYTAKLIRCITESPPVPAPTATP